MDAFLMPVRLLIESAIILDSVFLREEVYHISYCAFFGHGSYKNQSCAVKWNARVSESFEVANGVRQGGV